MSDTNSNDDNGMQVLQVYSADDSEVVQMLLGGRIPDGRAAPQQCRNGTPHHDAKDAEEEDEEDEKGEEGEEGEEEHHSDSNSYVSENDSSCEYNALKELVNELRNMVLLQQQTINHQKEQLESYRQCNERLLTDQHGYEQQMLAVNRQFDSLNQRVQALEKNRAKSRMDAPSRAQEILQSPVQMITMRTPSQTPGLSPAIKLSDTAQLSQSNTVLEERYIEKKLSIAIEQTKAKFPDFELSGSNLVAAKKYLSECYPIQDQLTRVDDIDKKYRTPWDNWKKANPEKDEDECLLQDPDAIQKTQEYPDPPKITFGAETDEAMGSDDTLKCESCKESGILMECTGCNKGIHFYCVDCKRPPKGGCHAYYCNMEGKCKASFFIKCLGWKPKSISEDKFDCGICQKRVSVTSRCNMVNANGEQTCGHYNQYCSLCIHKYVKAQKRGTESFGCPLCRKPCHALMMEGADEPELVNVLTMWNEHDSEPGLIDTLSIANSSRAIRRGRVRKTQEQLLEESQEREAIMNSRLLELSEQVRDSHDPNVVVDTYNSILGIEAPDDDDEDYDKSDAYTDIMRKLDSIYTKAHGRRSIADGKRKAEAPDTSELPMAKASKKVNKDAGSSSSSHDVKSPSTAPISIPEEDAAEAQKTQEVSHSETTDGNDCSDLFLDPSVDWMQDPDFLAS